MSISEVFRSHGIELDERQAIELIDNALLSVPGTRPAPTPLPPAEAAIYDAAEFSENPTALASQAADVAVQFIALLASSIPVSEAADRIGVSRSRMQQMVSAREVWVVRNGSKWALPAVQFVGDGLLPGWPKVAKSLPARMHPLEILGFLTTPQPELQLREQPRTAVEWLRSGGDPAVVEHLAADLSSIGV